ncbi:hypothetical protein cyc_03189 [Cyclospora cayetanensis]|uniref:Rhoptry neck protein n=1 Tax=Cyclospora cayetanensis TaxID=88456 RepID=A0A1D3D9I9_9EIME|nr:hypothetical protein cyc_03189 [Cyclospora cayetanensis]
MVNLRTLHTASLAVAAVLLYSAAESLALLGTNESEQAGQTQQPEAQSHTPHADNAQADGSQPESGQASTPDTPEASPDVVFTGLEIFRPRRQPLQHGSQYDAALPLLLTTPEANLERLKQALGSSWLSNGVRAGGSKCCMVAKNAAPSCPAAVALLSSLDCNMKEIQAAREAVTKLESSLLETKEEIQLPCAKISSKLLHYIDLMIFNTAFEAYEAGQTPQQALTQTFEHWGIQGDADESPGSSSSSFAERKHQVTSSSLPAANIVPVMARAPAQVPIKDIVANGLTNDLLRLYPRSQIFLSAARNPILKSAFMLFLLAYLRYEELFKPSSSSSKVRVFPSLVPFLTSSVASKLRDVDALCQITLGKVRSSPKMPPSFLSIPRMFFVRKQFGVGLLRVACDLLEDAVSTTQRNYESGLSFFNEQMNHLPAETRRYAVPLQKNAAPNVNFRRLCFSLGNRPTADMLFLPTPCTLKDLNIEQQSAPPSEAQTAEDTSFLQGAEQQIARPEAPRSSLVVEEDEKAFYYHLIATSGGNKDSLAPLLTRVAVNRSDFMLSKDPRTYTAIVKSVKKNVSACKKSRYQDLEKEMQKEGMRSSLEFSQKCTAYQDAKGWKKSKCEKFLIPLHCEYFDSTRSAIATRIDLKLSLGWMARQEPCIGRRCKKWERAHPFAMVASSPRQYQAFGECSPWIRALLTFYEWLGLYSLRAKDMDSRDAIYGLNEYQALFLMTGRHEKQGLFKKIFGLLKDKEKTTKMHVRFLMSQLSSDAMLALQSAFRPVVHPDTLQRLNQYAAFMSKPSGEVRDAGGLAKKLDKVISAWTYTGMPELVKEKLDKGLTPSKNDFKGFNLTQPPPLTAALNTTLKNEMLAAMGFLGQQADMQEQLWVACRNLSLASVSTQLLHDSRHLLQQAGDDLLIVGIVVNPKQTSAGLKGGLLERITTSIATAANKLLRRPAYELRHATYTAVVPDYSKIALVLKELSQIYKNNPSAFPSVDVFHRAADALFLLLEEQFFSPAGLPAGVPYTVMLNNVNPLYATLDGTERAAEFRRSVLSNFFSHLWKLALNVSIESLVQPEAIEKRELQYSKPTWLKSAMDPLQANSFRMIMTGGDFALKLFDNMLSKPQKKMLKSVKYGTGLIFTYNVHLSGKLYMELGYRSITNQLNAVAMSAQPTELVTQSGGTSLTNQSGFAGSGCGPMGICIDTASTSSAPDNLPISSSPALTAGFALLKGVVLIGLSSVLGPAISLYIIVSSHWKFLARIEMAIENLFKWILYKITHSRFGRWFKDLKESRKAKKEAARLAALSSGTKKKRKIGLGKWRRKGKGGTETVPEAQQETESLSEAEGNTDFNVGQLEGQWEDMFESTGGSAS